jgi:hypothetical protein
LEIVNSMNVVNAFEQKLAPAILSYTGTVVPKPNSFAKTVRDE